MSLPLAFSPKYLATIPTLAERYARRTIRLKEALERLASLLGKGSPTADGSVEDNL